MKSFYFKVRTVLQLVLLLSVGLVSQATAGVASIYAFGDGLTTTTDTPSPANLYHGGRRCNGKVWIESIAQWQGVPYEAAKNKSGFNYDSIVLKTNVTAFTQPTDANTSLFIVWSANADFVKFANDNTPWADSHIGSWNDKIAQSIDNHEDAINTLYSKGARLIVMPNAANVGAIPLYNNRDSTQKNFFRDRVISYNSQFITAMNTLAASKGNLKIIIPDVFTFFEHVQANYTQYGMVNPPNNGTPINAAVVAFPSTASATAGSPGTNYVFWDAWHPTAKFQMHLAAFIQQVSFPVKVNSLTLSGGNVQIQLANIPLGRAGSIQGSANLQPPWADDHPFTEPLAPLGSTTQTYSFAAVGSKRFYRAAFPVVWVWP